jgi:hypothetical protein
MDYPMEMVASRLTLEWEALMQALWTGLTGAVILATLAVAVGGVVMASYRTYRPRRFWCRSTGRDVEVLFEEWGPPGFRQTLRVAQCSAFEPEGDARVSPHVPGHGAPFACGPLRIRRVMSRLPVADENPIARKVPSGFCERAHVGRTPGAPEPLRAHFRSRMASRAERLLTRNCLSSGRCANDPSRHTKCTDRSARRPR